MDPDVTLEELLRLAHRVQRRDYGDSQVDDLAAHVIALDKWLFRGGFFPRRWCNNITEASYDEGAVEEGRGG